MCFPLWTLFLGQVHFYDHPAVAWASTLCIQVYHKCQTDSHSRMFHHCPCTLPGKCIRCLYEVHCSVWNSVLTQNTHWSLWVLRHLYILYEKDINSLCTVHAVCNSTYACVDTHHRVLVAKLVYLYVCTLVIAILPSSYEWRKITTSASWRVWGPSWALVWVEYSNQMQVAQWQGLVWDCARVQAAFGCCILLLLVPKMVFTFCNLLPDYWKCIAFIHNSTAALPKSSPLQWHCHVEIRVANGYFGRCFRPWHPDEITAIRLVEVLEWL